MLLAERGLRTRLIVRDAERAPSLPNSEIVEVGGYEDVDGMTAAVRGCETVLLVSGRETPHRLDEHLNAVDSIARAGARRVVYTSFAGASTESAFKLGRQHWYTEQHIRESGLDFTFLRNNFYLDFVPFFASAEGEIRGPAADGRVAFVARDDAADVAAAVLAESGHEDKTYTLTGGTAFDLYEAARVLTEYTGREVVYIPETEEQAYASRARFGAPDWEVEGWVSSYVAMARGEMEEVTDWVERLCGHPPMTLPELLERHPQAWEHLAGR